MIEKQIMEILKDQELFKTVRILDAKYTVIYRSNDTSLIIKSEGIDECVSRLFDGTLYTRRIPQITVNVYLPSSGVAVTWSVMNRKRGQSKYMVCQAIKWFDQPESPLFFLAVPEDITDIDVSQSVLSLFCSHIDECEDRLRYWTSVIDFK